jgi:hypothetical protein
MAYSRMCDRGPVISRERVNRCMGTKPYLAVFLFGGRRSLGARLFFWRGIMSNPLYRAERYCDLAKEYRAIAALGTPSFEIRAHYSRVTEHYSSLAEAEEEHVPHSQRS